MTSTYADQMLTPQPDPTPALDLLSGASVAVLTGAGVSTDSGIPDYRGPNAKRTTPMLHDEFLRSASNRQRYWARSFRGWGLIADARPNPGHRALARMNDRLTGIVTQNVDGLHEAAGSTPVHALHGRLAEVICMDCGAIWSRHDLQERLAELNPGVPASGHDDPTGAYAPDASRARPDGDMEVEGWEDFVVPACEACSGILKPHVVFFGGTVAKDVVEQCRATVADADVLLVLGSSLQVMSGLRFVRQAAKSGQPVIIVNRGSTRGDDLATICLDLGTTEFVQRWERASQSSSSPSMVQMISPD